MAHVITHEWLISGSAAFAVVRLTARIAASQTQVSPTLWYLTRALAVGAYVSLTLSVLFGALRSVARQSRERMSWVVDELHQVLAALSAALVVGHLATLLLDPFLPFSIQNLVLPVGEPYRPFAVILGVFALYTMTVLLLTSWFRSFLPYSFWRVLHYLSFVAFVLVTAHGLLAGSDASEPWMRAIYAGSAGAFGFVSLVRLLGGPRKVAVAKGVRGAQR
jgi:predicted ferric reductase